MNIKALVGSNLKRFRLQSGLTQAALAEVSRVSPRWIYQIETGNGNPTLEMLDLLSKGLGVPIASFFQNPEI